MTLQFTIRPLDLKWRVPSVPLCDLPPNGAQWNLKVGLPRDWPLLQIPRQQQLAAMR